MTFVRYKIPVYEEATSFILGLNDAKSPSAASEVGRAC
jgi:hypothetical protein